MAVAIGQITITDVLDGSYTESQYAANTSENTAPTTGWLSSIPSPQTGYYIWKKDRAVYADGTFGSFGTALRITGSKGDEGLTGAQGPPGTPGYLGLIEISGSLHLKGFDQNGNLTASIGYIYPSNSPRIMVSQFSQALTNEGKGYVLFDNTWAQKVRFVKMLTDSNLIVWRDYDTPGGTNLPATNANTYIIGMFSRTSIGESVIYDSMEIIAPCDLSAFGTSYLMSVLASGDMIQSPVWATALGVSKFISSLATLQAFADEFEANNVKVGGGNDSQGFRFRILKDGGNGKPLIDVTYNGVKTFSIDPDTGTVAMINSRISGIIEHEVLKTQESANGASATLPTTPKRWHSAELAGECPMYRTGESMFDSDPYRVPVSYVDPSGTLGAKTVESASYFEGTAGSIFAYTSLDAGSNYLVPYNGQIIVKTTPSFAGAYTYNGVSYSLGVNSQRVHTCSRGHEIINTAEVQPRSTNTMFIVSDVQTAGIHVGYTDGTREVIPYGRFYSSSINLGCFPSSRIRFISGANFVDALASQQLNTFLPATGTLVWEGVTKTITHVTRTSTGARVYCGLADIFDFQKDLTEGAPVGWHPASGNFTIITAIEGVITKTVYPFVDDISEIGLTDKYYHNIFITAFVGMVVSFASSTPPDGFLECNGSAISRTTYAKLFSRIGTAFGAGNGSTTFNIPDLRGEFVRGWDHSRGIDTSRAFATAQNYAMRELYGTFGATRSTGYNTPTGVFNLDQGGYSSTGMSGSVGNKYSFSASRYIGSTYIANEIRPRNIALTYCIKY